ncbi:MAG: hypothetical protein ABEJ42_03300 [Halobacteriaceae archaeon]
MSRPARGVHDDLSPSLAVIGGLLVALTAGLLLLRQGRDLPCLHRGGAADAVAASGALAYSVAPCTERGYTLVQTAGIASLGGAGLLLAALVRWRGWRRPSAAASLALGLLLPGAAVAVRSEPSGTAVVGLFAAGGLLLAVLVRRSDWRRPVAAASLPVGVGLVVAAAAAGAEGSPAAFAGLFAVGCLLVAGVRGVVVGDDLATT